MKILLTIILVLIFGIQMLLAQNFKLDNPPIHKAEVFMDGFISTQNKPEMCGALSADGDVFYYNAQHKGKWSIFVTRKESDQWSIPKPLNFTQNFTDRDFTMSPDGNKIYFGSDRPKQTGSPRSSSLDIFITEKISWDNWTTPQYIGDVINSEATENYPSVDAKGNLYFFSCKSGSNRGCELYVSWFVNNQYTKPVLLSNNINSEKHDWDSFIAPDGSYIIFSSKDRDDTLGEQDLYISFKDKDGKWIKAINMGSAVNSTDDEICPSISQDGKILFFTTRRRGRADVFWVSTEIIEELKPNNLK